MYLSLCLNQPSPMTMLEGMTAFEFNLWRRYFQKTTFGPYRDERQRAIIAATQVSAQMRRGRSVAPQKFMLKDEWAPGQRPKMSVQEMVQKARMITAALGGIDRTKYNKDREVE